MTRNPPPVLLVAAIFLAYALPGIFGHDPWKPDEPYTFGVVQSMLRTGDWLLPTVGGIPFVEKPPLYYWVAALSAQIGSDFVSVHDAARFASVVFLACTVAAVAGAARLAWDREAATPAVLLFLSAIGLEGHAQRMQVDLALMTGFAIAILGLAGCNRERPWAGLALGLGVAIGFFAKGLIAPAAIGLACALLPLLFEAWRTRRYAVQLAIAGAVSVPAMVAWPALLWFRSRELFNEWFWLNNVGRFTGAAIEKLGAQAAPGFWSATLPWFLFPLWIFALVALWRERRAVWDSPPLQIGLATALGLAIILFASASGRSVYALPLLPPLALLAVGATRPVADSLDRTLTLLAVVLGGAAIGFAWILWLFLFVHGEVPAAIPVEPLLPRKFEMPFSGAEIIGASALTLGFMLLVLYRRRFALAGLTLWVGALALAWGLAHTLWLPWLDYARSYRGVFAEIARRLPPDANCIIMYEVGESERALVEYLIGLPPRERFVREEECGALLFEGNRHHHRIWPGPGQWKLVWRGHRPDDEVEGFDLFLRPEARLPGEAWEDPRRTGGR